MLSDFTHTSSKELDEAIEKLEMQGMKKLLFDLRGNPGGVLEQAVDVTDVFVPKGSMVTYTRGRTASSAQEYFAPGDATHFDHPLVVLVNRGSASASEIVAGAIQDHDRGVVVGQRTWGKGLVQSVYTLSYGAGLALTTARYTASGAGSARLQRPSGHVNPGD
jgi:carboxyl-terminal processing protease